MHCMTVNVYAGWFFSRFSIIILIYIFDAESDLSRGALTATMTQLPAELIALLTRNQLPSRSKWMFIWWDDDLAACGSDLLKKQQAIVLLETQRLSSLCRSWLLNQACVPVAQWLEHCVSSAKVVGSIPREHMYWQYKCITWMHCKSFWIKASAKCINVNVNLTHL